MCYYFHRLSDHGRTFQKITWISVILIYTRRFDPRPHGRIPNRAALGHNRRADAASARARSQVQLCRCEDDCSGGELGKGSGVPPKAIWTVKGLFHLLGEPVTLIRQFNLSEHA
jgi:hypothetical protein